MKRAILLGLILVLAIVAGCTAQAKSKGFDNVEEFFGINPPDTMNLESSELVPISLKFYEDRHRVTKTEVLKFLREDKTDEKPYEKNYRECGWYSREVYNNASAQGLKVGFVMLSLADIWHHAVNVWLLEDSGYLFTCSTIGKIFLEGNTNWHNGDNSDKVVYLEFLQPPKGKGLFDTSLWYQWSTPVDAIKIYW